MNKDVEIGQVNELKFYLAWDYVKEICSEAVRKENEQLHKFLEEFNALEVAKENQQLKEVLKECYNIFTQEQCSDCGLSMSGLIEICTKIEEVLEEKK